MMTSSYCQDPFSFFFQSWLFAYLNIVLSGLLKSKENEEDRSLKLQATLFLMQNNLNLAIWHCSEEVPVFSMSSMVAKMGNSTLHLKYPPFKNWKGNMFSPMQ